jgi:uncharacterized protein (DUF4213/DUF364 family)
MSREIQHSLLDHLGRGFPEAPKITELVRPPSGAAERVSPFTLVLLDNGRAGLSWNLLDDDDSRRRYDALQMEDLVGGDALELARDLVHDEIVRRIVGYAACSALSQTLILSRHRQQIDIESDLLDLLAASPDDHVGLVGYSPRLVKALVDSGARVTVLERRPVTKRDDLTVGADPQLLASCDKVLFTSTTLLNDTFDELEQITSNATFRALYGPGAAILPAPFFELGFHAIGGTLITDPPTLADRQRQGERWGDAKTKFVLSR